MTLKYLQRPTDRVFDACGIAALFNLDQKPVTGTNVQKMIALMRERENGLGGGYAAYGLFPKHADNYCIQLLLEDVPGKKPTLEIVEEYLKTKVNIIKDETVPIDEEIIDQHPMIHRFFVDPPQVKDPDEYMKEVHMDLNTGIEGAFVMSSGKNMAVFKGNAWADQVGSFYKIGDIKAYMWTAHSRFPTNTPGWWGGAHPFNLLGTSVVHNGEITSYGTNVNYLEELGYPCTLRTDTEVLAYLFDYIVRKSNFPPEIAHKIATTALAPPYWRDIELMGAREKKWMSAIRQIYRKAMANGPFAIIITTDNPKPYMIGHTDRKKLRPLIAALSEDQSTFYLSSEVNAIHLIDETEDYWQANPGQPIIASIDGIESRGNEPIQAWIPQGN